MEKAYKTAEELVNNIKDYLNIRTDALKLEITEKSAELISNLIVGSVVFMVFLICLVFASIALAFGIGEWTGKIWLGFLIVSGAYLIFGIVALFLKDKIIRDPLMNGLIKQFYKNEERN